MIDTKKLEEEQLRMAKKVILKNSFDKIKTVGGADQSSFGRNIISAIVVCDYKTMEVIEKQHAVMPAKMPYISGFRAYREGTAISEAYYSLSSKPDVLIFYGNGILHPRKFGIASHMGVLFGQPSIGVTSSLALGIAKGSKVAVENSILAEIVETRKHSKPVYISPGHLIDLATSVEVVKNCIRHPHKLPEPLHLAHKHASEVKKNREF